MRRVANTSRATGARCQGAKLVARPCARRAAVHVICATGPVPDKSVVVIGGTGRVGSSTAATLLKEFPNLKVTVASRSDDSFKAAVERRPELSKAGFQRVDITNADSVQVRGSGARL